MRFPAAVLTAAGILGVSSFAGSMTGAVLNHYTITGSRDTDGAAVAWRIDTRSGEVQYCTLGRNPAAQVTDPQDPFDKLMADSAPPITVSCSATLGTPRMLRKPP